MRVSLFYRLLIGFVFSLALVIAFPFALIATRRRWMTEPVIAILAAHVVARTVLIGIVLNWMVYRYMVTAWLPLLVVVFLAPRFRITTSASAAATSS